jgi:hypothetical protein
MLKKAVEKFGRFIFVYTFVRSIRHNIKTKRYENYHNKKTSLQLN